MMSACPANQPNSCNKLSTRSLAPADFSGAVFTCVEYRNFLEIFALCGFNSFTHVHFHILVCWFMWIFLRLKKRASQGLGAART